MNELLLQGLSELGLDVSRVETLERFSSLLLEKNQVMNLTAITEPDAVAQLHLLDSAALLPFVGHLRGVCRRGGGAGRVDRQQPVFLVDLYDIGVSTALRPHRR